MTQAGAGDALDYKDVPCPVCGARNLDVTPNHEFVRCYNGPCDFLITAKLAASPGWFRDYFNEGVDPSDDA